MNSYITFRKAPVIRAIKNVNNACYFNATIQLLAACPLLLENPPTISTDAGVLLRGLLRDVTTPGESIDLSQAHLSRLLPGSFLKGSGGRLQDPAELLMYAAHFFRRILLLRHLLPSLKQDDLFTYEMTSKLVCPQCNTERAIGPERLTSVYPLDLPSTQDAVEFQHIIAAKAIEDRKCDGCQVHLSRLDTLVTVSKVFLCQLKRFNSRNDAPKCNRIRVHVSSTFEFSKRTYELRAIVCHNGGVSVHEGHYTCWVRLPSEHWVLVNDSAISAPTDFATVSASIADSAYLLLATSK